MLHVYVIRLNLWMSVSVCGGVFTGVFIIIQCNKKTTTPMTSNGVINSQPSTFHHLFKTLGKTEREEEKYVGETKQIKIKTTPKNNIVK